MQENSNSAIAQRLPISQPIWNNIGFFDAVELSDAVIGNFPLQLKAIAVLLTKWSLSSLPARIDFVTVGNGQKSCPPRNHPPQ